MAPQTHAERGGGTTSMGIEPNLAALISYVLGFVTGMVFYLGERDNKFVRFHALQSTILSIVEIVIIVALQVVGAAVLFTPGLTVVGVVIFSAVLPIFVLAVLVLWVMLMMKAYQGEHWSLPIIGSMADKNA